MREAEDTVLVEVAPLTYRTFGLAQALLMGARRSGTKKWPSGLSEPLYVLPAAVRRQKKDDGRRGLGSGRVVLTERERRSLETQIGEPVSDAQDARRKMAAKGMRLTEKGEFADEMLDALKEAGESGGPVDPRYSLENLDLFGDRKHEKKVDLRDRYLFHCQRLGITPQE